MPVWVHGRAHVYVCGCVRVCVLQRELEGRTVPTCVPWAPVLPLPCR